ncbi:MAG: phosphate ABC transporter substrate-binding protein [Chthoniobacter sp.]|nr:phosphate ABC transporter substrate-binding protein [Chthoniobacter sp.]
MLLAPVLACGQSPPKEPALHSSIVGLWLMGQSLCEGAESLPIITSADSGWGNYAFRRGVRTWAPKDHGAQPELRKDDQFAFEPLVAREDGGLGETIANGLADHWKATLPGTKTTATKDGAPHFLAAYAGQGGMTIAELSAADETTDPREPAVKQHGGGYYKTSLDDARRASQQAKSQGGSFTIGALIWMQGEANGGPHGGIVPSRWKDELPRPAGQEWYRDQLIAYRQAWSDDLRAITGQADEIPMFTYQTLGPAGEAQLMAADRDPRIIMVGPHYMVPSAINSRRAGAYGAAIHLSADGQRWFGEQVAKVVRRVVQEGEHWQPLRPRKAWIEAARDSVMVEFAVPRPPLILDESFLPREQSETGTGFSSLCGFQIRGATKAAPPIIAVETASPTQVRIRLASALPEAAEYTLAYGLSYAGQIGTISSLRSRTAANGQPMTELLIEGKLPDRAKPLLAEGAFNVANMLGDTAFAEAPVRRVDEEQGFTVLAFEDRERRNNVDFAAGQTLTALRPFLYGNLRDSDPEPAIYSFADTTYGTRAGQRYPLWNWCVHFSGFPISDL